MMETSIWAIGLVIIATIVGSPGPIFLKKGAKDFRMDIRALLTNRNIVIGVLAYAFGTILFIPALKFGELSVLYPFVALTYVWVSLLSMSMLNEKMNALKWAGVFVIIMGVISIGLGS